MQPQAFFNRVSREALASDLQSLWIHSATRRGDATFFEVMGHTPEAMRWYIDHFGRHLFHSGRVELGRMMAVLVGMAKFIFAYDLVEKEDCSPFTPDAARL